MPIWTSLRYLACTPHHSSSCGTLHSQNKRNSLPRSLIFSPHLDLCLPTSASQTILRMARPKKSGAAARVRDSDSDFSPRKRSPTKPKPTSPQKQHPSPRKGRKAAQQALIDDGIAATPDDSSRQAPTDHDDSTYDSSPPKASTAATLLQTPLRKNAARSTRSRKPIIDQSSESLEAEQAGQAGAAPPVPTKSRIVVLQINFARVKKTVWPESCFRRHFSDQRHLRLKRQQRWRQ